MAEGVLEAEEIDAGLEGVGGVSVTKDSGINAAVKGCFAGIVGDDVLEE